MTEGPLTACPPAASEERVEDTASWPSRCSPGRRLGWADFTLICSPTEDKRPRSLRVNRSRQAWGSNSPARLKIFPTAWAKFICQSPKELVPASVWKCQPVWLEECEESFPLNSRKHMGGGWRPTPQPANSRSSGAKRGPEGSGIPTTSQGGGAGDGDSSIDQAESGS